MAKSYVISPRQLVDTEAARKKNQNKNVERRLTGLAPINSIPGNKVLDIVTKGSDLYITFTGGSMTEFDSSFVPEYGIYLPKANAAFICFALYRYFTSSFEYSSPFSISDFSTFRIAPEGTPNFRGRPSFRFA